MQESTFRTWEIVIAVATAMGLPAIIYIIKLAFNTLENTRDIATLASAFTNHKETCHPLPASQVLERIDNLCEKIDKQHEDMKEFREEIREEVKMQRDRYHSLNNFLQKLYIKENGA